MNVLIADSPSEMTIIGYLTDCGLGTELAKDLIEYFGNYQELVDEVNNQKAIVAAWEEKPRCWGSISWKDTRRKEYMNINHTVPRCRDFGICPAHGWHSSGDTSKRFMHYVGKDILAQDDVKIAMKNWAHWEDACEELKRFERKLLSRNHAIRSLVKGSGYQSSMY